jgi:enoyl-CoA hydratase/carnithine racemase
LIAAITLLHQYQRQRIARGGKPCLVATLDDARLANQLAASTFAPRVDELLPQAQQLLEELARHVSDEAQRRDVPRSEVRFTQRQLREALPWSDRSLRRQLARLVELEYVLCYRTRRGNQRAYQLLYDPRTATAAAAWQLGLCSLEQLRGTASRQTRT